MRDHYAFRTRGGAAGVIDCEQISLVDFRTDKFRRAPMDHRFVIEPALAFSAKGDEVLNAWKAGPNAVDCAKIIAVCADHARPTMVDQVNEVVGCEAIV